MENARILLFVYNRLEHTKKTVESLKNNNIAKDSELIIYSDGFKGEKDKLGVINVRNYITTIEGFKNIKIVESPKNKGLATSIIEGVTEIINKYGKVIVLEDDLITTNDFLEYMNEGLNRYEEDKRIWSISGYSPKLDSLKKEKEFVYLGSRSCSWGWATWKNRWELIDWNIKEYNLIKRNKFSQDLFNIGGNDLFFSLKKQIEFNGNSWAIRWCYNQMKNGMYTLYPKFSKIKNIGFDNSGVHSYSKEAKKWEVNLKENKIIFPQKLEINFEILEEFKSKHNITFRSYAGYWLRKIKIFNYLNKKGILKKINL